MKVVPTDADQRLDEWLNDREFYELMQAYRHASPLDQFRVTNAFRTVIATIRVRVKEIYERDEEVR